EILCTRRLACSTCQRNARSVSARFAFFRRCGIRGKGSNASETPLVWAFLSIVKNCIVEIGKRVPASRRASRQRGCARKIWCREEGTHAYRAKMLVFFARCSNPIAVFAILRALNDIATHSG